MTIVSVCAIIAAATALVAISLQYYFSKQLVINSTQAFSKQVAGQIELSISKMDDTASNTVSLLSKFSDLVEEGQVSETTFGLFKDVLVEHNEFYAIYLGLSNGDFHELINLETNQEIRSQLNAAPNDRFVRITIYNDSESRVKQTDFLDEHLNVRHSITEDSNYDATSRHWFQNANKRGVYKSKPYLFQHLQATGQTYSHQMVDGDDVIAVDSTLTTIANQLNKNFERNKQHESTKAYVFGGHGELLLTNEKREKTNTLIVSPIELTAEQQALIENLGEVTVSNENDWAPLDFAISGAPKGYTPELIMILSEKLGLDISFINGFSWPELVAEYKRNKIDVLQPLHQTAPNRKLGHFSNSLLNLPFALATKAENSYLDSLVLLNSRKVAVPKGWQIKQAIENSYPMIQVISYPTLKDALLAVKNGDVDAAIDTGLILRYTAKMFFIEGLSFQNNIDISRLDFDTNLHLVSKNKELIELFDIALRHLSYEENSYLRNRWLLIEKNVEVVDGSATVPYKELVTLASDPSYHGVIHVVELNGTEYLIFISPTQLGPYEHNYLAIMMPTDSAYAEGLKNVATSILFTLAILVVLMPAIYLGANPIVLAMRKLTDENDKIRKRQYDKLVPQSSFITDINEVFVSLDQMVKSIQEYERKQAELLDAFVELIAQAIDDKSPYTAGHCNRVPELGLMMADVASASELPHFQSFRLDTEDKQREFRLAAWLHDCGKIITPEHIVDKGSKLECIYNRIHEVRMRFEVLWRDAQIRYLKAMAVSPEDELAHKKSLAEQQDKLQKDFEFIAACNQGGEFMAEEKLAQLEEIAKQTWLRNFDDKIGLSPQEELQVSKDKPNLPVLETLLMDKSDHIIARERAIEYPEHFGIKVEVPTNKANLGELYNLRIGRGTLTPEDRFIINEHIIGTIKMLDAMPFPKELSNVPRYASTHHETLKGTGYPRRLTAEELSIPERILVLADIFEALTASDRPYKKAKPLSVAIDILHKMSLDDHIDIEVFKLFISSGVYLGYAKRFLPEAQIDEIDVNKYLS